jgi:hypothetical protein
MNESWFIKERAQSLILSLEALSSVERTKPPPRPLTELLAEWADKPPAISDALRAQTAARAMGEDL